jgi:RNA polymerase sigma-70 factor (ECF subfamily)
MAGNGIEAVFRSEAGRVLGTLIRLLGDFELAEEALQDAFAAAIEAWPQSGPPDDPHAWLIHVGRHKGIDRLRRRILQRRTLHDMEAHAQIEAALQDVGSASDHQIGDDTLRLIFTCCHPALSLDSQVALTLRAVCGLSTEAVARAFLISPESMAQRLVRTQRKIRVARIPYETPELRILDERLDGVLAVIYLVFTEGYAGSSGAALMQSSMADEAVRLARLVDSLLPARAAVLGLMALMLLHRARHPARATPEGDIILLEHQDRTLWDQTLISEGAGGTRVAHRRSGQRLRGAGGDRSPACAGASLQRYRLAADCGALCRSDAHPTDRCHRAQPCGRGLDGGWAGARAATGRSGGRAR